MECQHIRIGDRAKELAGFSVDEESKCTTQEKRIAEADLKAGRSNDYRVAALLDLADIAIVNCPPRLSLCTIVQQLLSGGVYDLTEDVVTSTQRTIAGAYIEYIFDAFENVGVAEKSAQLVKVLGHESAWPLAREEWVQLNRERPWVRGICRALGNGFMKITNLLAKAICHNPTANSVYKRFGSIPVTAPSQATYLLRQQIFMAIFRGNADLMERFITHCFPVAQRLGRVVSVEFE